MNKMTASLTAFLSLVSITALAIPAPAPVGSEKKGGMMSMDGMMKGCQEHHAAMTKSMDEAAAAIARGKESSDPAKMRQALDDAQAKIAEMKNHMSICMDMMNKMGGMHGDMMGGKGTKGEKGMMGGGMMSSEKKAAAKVTDPVCGMEVDPKTAPSASYNGKTYYFCSAEDKAKFEKNPEAYVKKKPV